ncbi:glycosyltransferase [Roseomonas stagni]|uniref:Glycosyltransferase n=1 Tax=Falsiroseomonas algicola TaxID=2716930 RepID=A0A6M1LR87_9PROT|nr:glycosyltransferase family 4 protein [Falsiroseomonas algicola]NGM22928.1 glycosyltransferase [Falsiroseomonas algicola]
MDVVFVTDVAFWERSLGSEERIHQLVTALAPSARVGVFFINRTQREVPKATPVPVYSSTAIEVPPGQKPEQPKGIEFGFDAATAAAFAAFCQQHRPQLGIYEYVTTAYLALCAGAPPFKVLDTHDVMSQRARTFARFGRKHHIDITAQDELRILHRFDCILAIQGEDLEHLGRALGRARVLYLPLMVAPPPPRRYRSRPVSVLFVGGNSPMNADGMRWFCREVWPLVRQGDLRLDVVGAVGASIPAEVQGVVRHGRLQREALEAAYLDADIAINPVYYGGGLKVKTIEYAGFGIPSVVTGEALRGVPHDPATAPFLLARTREEFVLHLRHLLHDPAARLELAERAPAFIEARYSTRHAATIQRLAACVTGIAA